MKKFVFVIVLILATVSASGKRPKKITILHTSDTHSCILPLNENLADRNVAGRGGFIRRISMLKQERQKDPSLLLFDCGDFSQGSSFYTMFQGDVEVGLMNQMHYDAVTIGNHEFDFGLENMIRLFKTANFPVVCSNYDFRGTVVEHLVKDYVILKRNGLKIGVFGLSPKLDGLVDSKNCVGVKFLDPIEQANRVVSILKKKKCDVIILLSHLGWDVLGVSDEELIAATRDIDLVLGGHSHSYLETLQFVDNLNGKAVPVDQNGKHAIYVGKMVLDFKKK